MEKPPVEQQVFQQAQQQTELDDDTRYLMEFHQQIVPSQNLVNAFLSSNPIVNFCFFQLDTIEEFVSAVENALKSCSDQLRPLPAMNNDQTSESLT